MMDAVVIIVSGSDRRHINWSKKMSTPTMVHGNEDLQLLAMSQRDAEIVSDRRSELNIGQVVDLLDSHVDDIK
jgi:hypothetical protein